MASELSILRTGPFCRLQQAVGLMDADNPRTVRRAVLFALISWLPLVALAGVQGLAINDDPERSVLMDFSTYARFLLAVPLLIVGEAVADKRFLMIADYFIASGIVAGPERQAYNDILSKTLRFRDSWVAELCLLLLAYAGAGLGIFYTVKYQPSTWLVADAAGSRALSWAGWWDAAVSLPLFQFLLYHFFWSWLVWFLHLWRLSRLKLQLMPTHPDLAGGLNILGDSPYAVAIFVFAIGSVVSSVWAEQIVYYGASVGDFHQLFIAYLLLALLFSFSPLLVFAGKLNSLRLWGLRNYGALASCNAQLFDEKWIKNAGATGESILGNHDVSSLADLTISYEAVDKMKVFPLGWRSIALIAAAALAPMAPLILMEFPLTEILKAMAGVVF
jgi:hypothetical protein